MMDEICDKMNRVADAELVKIAVVTATEVAASLAAVIALRVTVTNTLDDTAFVTILAAVNITSRDIVLF
jgi:hypothetical protein